MSCERMSHSPSQQVTALIVAGGRSRRMGVDKALVSWQGIPLLGRVFVVAQACCTQVSVLTPWPERYQTLLPSTVNWLVESPTFAGPMAALVQGMEAIQTPWVLLLACDMPQLEGAVLMRWIQALSETTAIAHVPYHQNRWEPLCGFYHMDALASLKAYVAEQGDRASFQKWLCAIDAVPLAVDSAISPMLFNCNTPKELTVH
jgi:molybdenum cofactor guanylyltransferase